MLLLGCDSFCNNTFLLFVFFCIHLFKKKKFLGGGGGVNDTNSCFAVQNILAILILIVIIFHLGSNSPATCKSATIGLFFVSRLLIITYYPIPDIHKEVRGTTDVMKVRN